MKPWMYLALLLFLIVAFCLGVKAAPVIDHIQPLPVPTVQTPTQLDTK